MCAGLEPNGRRPLGAHVHRTGPAADGKSHSAPATQRDTPGTRLTGPKKARPHDQARRARSKACGHFLEAADNLSRLIRRQMGAAWHAPATRTARNSPREIYLLARALARPPQTQMSGRPRGKRIKSSRQPIKSDILGAGQAPVAWPKMALASSLRLTNAQLRKLESDPPPWQDNKVESDDDKFVQN